MKYRITIVAAVAAAVVGGLLSAPVAASASDSCGHCASAEYWAPYDASQVTGLSADVYTHCIHINPPANSFVDNEVWFFVGSYQWIEAGITEGSINGSTYSYPVFFVADENSNGYHAHTDGTQASLDTSYQITINYVSGTNGEYYARVGPYSLDITNMNQPNANDSPMAGVEVSGGSGIAAYESGYLDNLGYYEGNALYSGWSDTYGSHGTTTFAYGDGNGFVSSTWDPQYSRVDTNAANGCSD